MLKLLVILTAVILLIGSATVNAAAQQPTGELETLKTERLRQYNAGQYDAAIAIGKKELLLTEQLFGSDANEVASAANLLALSYYAKRDLVNAELYHRRALVIYEKQPPRKGDWMLCQTLKFLGRVDYQRNNWDSTVSFYERALNCFETRIGPTESMTFGHLIELAKTYFEAGKRPDLVAKADLLLQKWFPIVEQARGPDAVDVGKLLIVRAKIYAMHGEKEKAKALRMRALAIAEKQPDPTKTDSDRLKLALSVLLELREAHRGPFDSESLGLLVHSLAIEEKLYGKEHPYVVRSRKHLAEMRAANPNVQLPGSVSTNSKPVYQAAPPALPAKPTPAAGEVPQGLRATSKNVVLRPPKGYEHLRPATLYTLSPASTSGWIVARTRQEAANLYVNEYPGSTATSRSFWSACLLKSCSNSVVELGYGWMATLKAESYDGPRGSVRTDYFYAYEGASRKAVIDLVVAEYRKSRGNLVIQDLRVGLVSEIPYAALRSYFSRGGYWAETEGGPWEINYKTRCDWTRDAPRFGGKTGPTHDKFGRNVDPNAFAGDADKDPACENRFRPDEKLPPPLLVVGP